MGVSTKGVMVTRELLGFTGRFPVWVIAHALRPLPLLPYTEVLAGFIDLRG